MKKYYLLLHLSLLAGLLTAQVTINKKDVTCRGGNDGWLTVTVANAALPIKSYVWNDGVTNQSRLNVPAGNYCVTVTDKNDCTGQDCITVEQPETALHMDISITPDPVTVPCGIDQPVWVSAYVSGGGYPYNLNGAGHATQVIRVEQTMNVRFRVTDDNGCTLEKEQRVYILPRVCPGDPNEITGPVGFDDVRWVSVKDTLDYDIKYENDPAIATAPAQRVVITHHFDEDINPFTFRLGTFGFGGLHFDVPGSPAFYQTRLDLIAQLGLYLDVVAGIDVNTNSAFWIFESIDPQTGLLPVNPLVGYLPVNDTITHGGEGYVSFLVKPKLPGHTGDTILATGSIVFDINEPVITNTWKNRIDAFAPSTSLDPLPMESENNIIPLSWTGSDDPGGSGLDHYELYYSKNSAAYQLFQVTFPDSVHAYNFEGEFGSEYSFYLIGVDHVGNKEIGIPGEQTISILPRKVIELIKPAADEYCVQDTLWMQWSLIEINAVNVSISNDSGQTFTPLFSSLPSSDTLKFLILPPSWVGQHIQIQIHDAIDTTVVFSSILPIKGLPEILAGDDKNICEGDVAFLVPEGANTYRWSPDTYINNPNLTVPAVNPPSDQKYYVIGTDVFGCRNIDSLWVFVHPNYLDSVAYPMCNEDSIFLEGAYQTEAGFYTDHLSSFSGCDSTVVTEVILTGPCPFPSPQVYVDKDAIGLNNGTSWANAFNDLQDALDAVEYYNSIREVWIAEGEYHPSPAIDRNVSYLLRDSVTIYGGFLGTESARSERVLDPSLVRLSGDLGIANDSTDNAYHVVKVDSLCGDCILDGLTISFGHANGIPVDATIGAGLVVNGKVLLNNLVIERNTTTMDGAAIYNSGANAILTIQSCIFRLNTSGLQRDILNTGGAQINFQGLNTIQD